MRITKAKILALTYCCIFMAVMIIFTKSIFIYVLAPLSIITYLIWWVFEDELIEKYNLRPFDKTARSKTIIIMGVLFSPALFITFIVCGIHGNNFLGGLGLAIAISYPLIFMFLRMNTFSNSISEKGGFGYFLASYFLFSFAIGTFTTAPGFSGLNFYFTHGNPSLEFALVSILLGLFCQTIILLPDKINKFSPIDLRERKGLLFMFIFTGLLFMISQDIIRLFI